MIVRSGTPYSIDKPIVPKVRPFQILPSRISRVRGLGAYGFGIQNLSTGDPAHFKIGDQFRITLSGAQPGEQIYLNTMLCGPGGTPCVHMPYSGEQDLPLSILTGQYQGVPYTGLGVADSSGTWSLSGTFNSSQLGEWSINWSDRGRIHFSVADANGNVPIPSQINQAPGGTAFYTLATSHAPATPLPMSAFDEAVIAAKAAQIAAQQPGSVAIPGAAGPSGGPTPGPTTGVSFNSIPIWMWVAGGLGILFFFGRKSG